MVAVKPVSASGDFWTQKASMQVPRSGLGVAVVDGKIYAIGGSTESGVTGVNEVYNPATNTWEIKAPMPTPLHSFGTVVYQGKIYCIGGSVNEVYDPATDTWAPKTPMPTAREALQANLVGDRIYLIGGYPNYTLNEVYDITTDSWSTKTPMPNGATYYASAVVDDKIYIIGNSNVLFPNSNQIYDPTTDKWSTGSPAPTFFIMGAAGATTGAMTLKRIYVLGQPATNTFEALSDSSTFNKIYDPKTDSWTIGKDLPTHRSLFGVAVVDDKIYAIGGFVTSFRDELARMSGEPTFTNVGINEVYTPIGYGTPDPDYKPPTPSPTPSSSASPSPTPSPEPQQLDQFPVIWIAAAVPAVVITIGLLVYFKKYHH